jgi:two-component system response regulator
VNDGPILLVEDNPDDVMFTLRAFQKNNLGNEVIVATDGEEARQLLLPDEGPPSIRPSLVLLDVKLPKIDGLALLRMIRSDVRTQSLPVVILTTSNEERDIVESYRLGANSFVRKPVVFGDFLHAANVLGMYWMLVNESAPAWRGGPVRP